MINFSTISLFYRQKKGLLRIFFAILTFIAWIFFFIQNFSNFHKLDVEFSIYIIVLSLIFSTIYFLILAFAWAVLLSGTIIRTSSKNFIIYKSMRAWLLTIMTRYLPGNVWHILSRVAFADQLNVGKTNIIAISTLEQGFTVLGASLVAAIFFSFNPLIPFSQNWLCIKYLPILFSIITLVLIHPRVLSPSLRYVAKKIKKPELVWQLGYNSTIFLVLLYSVATFSSGLALVLILTGLGLANISNNILFIIGSSSFAWVVGYLSFLTPGGLGVREGVLTALLAYIYPLPIAIVASLLFRIVCTLGEFIALLFFSLFNRFFVSFEINKKA